jgi:hypothetical protein
MDGELTGRQTMRMDQKEDFDKDGWMMSNYT